MTDTVTSTPAGFFQIGQVNNTTVEDLVSAVNGALTISDEVAAALTAANTATAAAQAAQTASAASVASIASSVTAAAASATSATNSATTATTGATNAATSATSAGTSATAAAASSSTATSEASTATTGASNASTSATAAATSATAAASSATSAATSATSATASATTAAGYAINSGTVTAGGALGLVLTNGTTIAVGGTFATASAAAGYGLNTGTVTGVGKLNLILTNGTTVTAAGLVTPAERGALGGLITSRNGGTPNTQIDISAGYAMDEVAQAGYITSSGVLTINAATTGANGLDSGSLANSTVYHVFVIGKTDGTVAGFMSTSLTPTLPTGYTLRRRIGSVRTDSSAHFLAYVQLGDEFLLAAGIADEAALGVTNSATLLALSVPTGIQVNALFNGEMISDTAATLGLFTSPDQTSTAANTPAGNFQLDVAVALGADAAQLNIRTNTSGQVRFISSIASPHSTLSIVTQGWVDTRGRFA